MADDVNGDALEAMAEIVHNARWPADWQVAVTPFANEDRNGREYCFRIARAVLAAQPEQPAAVEMYSDALKAANKRIAELEDKLWKAAFPKKQEPTEDTP